MHERTSIALAPGTKQRLASFGAKSESFDAILLRLMDEAGWIEQEARWNRMLREEPFTSVDEL
ncbi:MAG: hypothetical protein WC876_00475 [Candidatus Thermoplasmatota archaeon]